jgi:hypothetical protein
MGLQLGKVKLRRSRRQGGVLQTGSNCPNWVTLYRRKWFPFRPVLTARAKAGETTTSEMRVKFRVGPTTVS